MYKQAFAAVGINHKTAPLELREKVSIGPQGQVSALSDFLSDTRAEEAAILSTCNRTEIYCIVEGHEKVMSWLARRCQMPLASLETHCYAHVDQAGIRHMARVACGLDSMILGESQILGQLKQTYQLAEKSGALGRGLQHIFRQVFTLSKQVRRDTTLTAQPVTIAYGALQLIEQIFDDRKHLQMLCIGAGRTSQLLARYLCQAGIKQLWVANRDLAHAQALADELSGTAISLQDIGQYLAQSDVVVSAIHCDEKILCARDFQKAQPMRRYRPQCVIDLSVPRSIDPDLQQLADVFLYNMDDLQTKVQTGVEHRQHQALIAEDIIERGMDRWAQLSQQQRMQKSIENFRGQLQHLSHAELDRASRALQNGQDPQVVLQDFSRRLMKKWLHQPTERIKQVSEDAEKLSQTLDHLFATETK